MTIAVDALDTVAVHKFYLEKQCRDAWSMLCWIWFITFGYWIQITWGWCGKLVKAHWQVESSVFWFNSHKEPLLTPFCPCARNITSGYERRIVSVISVLSILEKKKKERDNRVQQWPHFLIITGSGSIFPINFDK